MRVVALTARDFRCYESARASFGENLTVITGPNGAGKTNLLEALYFGCTGRSCRTNNEREVVRFGSSAARVVVDGTGEDGPHELAVGFVPGQPKRMRVDGAVVDRMLDAPQRPLVGVFLPDRLELIKGPPSLRRAHLDQFVSGLWPARAGARRTYAQALAQRNALISRIRSGGASGDSLRTWDAQLARYGIELMADRGEAVAAMSPAFARMAEELGLGAEVTVRYRPSSKAATAEDLAAELADRAAGDIERGFTGHGPHRDELITAREGRELRVYGSQGQQRLGLLALLLAERDTIAKTRSAPPLMLLDDVMSELDGTRREALIHLLRSTPGQSVITTTDLEHVPGAREPGVERLAVDGGVIVHDALVA